MKLTKDDAYNLSCLKLYEMGAWTSERCLESIVWKVKTKRARERYIKRMIQLLADVDNAYPTLIENSFKNNIQPTINELEEIKNGRKEKSTKENSTKENSTKEN